jgi:hypothetical protein
MGYSVESSSERRLVWNDNPVGGESYAVVTDNVITELQVQDANGVSVVYTIDQTLLTHLNTVLTQLLAEVTPA